MPRDPRAYLWDARHAALHAVEFVRGKSFEARLRGREPRAGLAGDPRECAGSARCARSIARRRRLDAHMSVANGDESVVEQAPCPHQ